MVLHEKNDLANIHVIVPILELHIYYPNDFKYWYVENIHQVLKWLKDINRDINTLLWWKLETSFLSVS